MKKLVLFLATVVLALTSAIEIKAQNNHPRPPIEDVVIGVGGALHQGPRRSVQFSKVSVATTNIVCSEMGQTYLVIMDKKGDVVDSAFIDADENDEVTVVVANPEEGDSYSVVVISAYSYEELKLY